jgi:hypothetical protein
MEYIREVGPAGKYHAMGEMEDFGSTVYYGKADGIEGEDGSRDYSVENKL